MFNQGAVKKWYSIKATVEPHSWLCFLGTVGYKTQMVDRLSWRSHGAHDAVPPYNHMKPVSKTPWKLTRVCSYFTGHSYAFSGPWDWIWNSRIGQKITHLKIIREYPPFARFTYFQLIAQIEKAILFVLCVLYQICFSTTKKIDQKENWIIRKIPPS